MNAGGIDNTEILVATFGCKAMHVEVTQLYSQAEGAQCRLLEECAIPFLDWSGSAEYRVEKTTDTYLDSMKRKPAMAPQATDLTLHYSA